MPQDLGPRRGATPLKGPIGQPRTKECADKQGFSNDLSSEEDEVVT